ncbi:hypothetical protein SDC9_186754 [bioreactor metagenome]|uniref:Uncharacterized protein n=1 Tax=bioreactor metagenome TaxID=1076179 RepID=A0A645HKU2_9ZZZZ
MGRPIVGRETRPIHTENDGQRLKSRIMHDAIEGTLHKRGVNGDNGMVSHGCHGRGKNNGMFFGNTYINILLRAFSGQYIQACSAGHSSRDADDIFSTFAKLEHRISENFLPGRRGRRF